MNLRIPEPSPTMISMVPHVLAPREQDFSSIARHWGGKKSLRGGRRLMSWFGYGWWKKSCTNNGRNYQPQVAQKFLPSTVDTPQKTHMEPPKRWWFGSMYFLETRGSHPFRFHVSVYFWECMFPGSCEKMVVSFQNKGVMWVLLVDV